MVASNTAHLARKGVCVKQPAEYKHTTGSRKNRLDVEIAETVYHTHTFPVVHPLLPCSSSYLTCKIVSVLYASA